MDSTTKDPSIVRRVKYVRIDPDSLTFILKELNGIFIESGIPSSARCIGGTYDSHTRCFKLFIEDISFEEVNVVTGEIPELQIVFRRIPVKPSVKI